MKIPSWLLASPLASKNKMKKLNNSQKKMFWISYISFCIIVTTQLYYDEAFLNMSFGPSVFLLILYLVVALALHRYVLTNPDDFD